MLNIKFFTVKKRGFFKFYLHVFSDKNKTIFFSNDLDLIIKSKLKKAYNRRLHVSAFCKLSWNRRARECISSEPRCPHCHSLKTNKQKKHYHIIELGNKKLICIISPQRKNKQSEQRHRDTFGGDECAYAWVLGWWRECAYMCSDLPVVCINCMQCREYKLRLKGGKKQKVTYSWTLKHPLHAHHDVNIGPEV